MMDDLILIKTKFPPDRDLNIPFPTKITKHNNRQQTTDRTGDLFPDWDNFTPFTSNVPERIQTLLPAPAVGTFLRLTGHSVTI